MFINLLQRSHSEKANILNLLRWLSQFDQQKAVNDLDKIAVVPNPYVGAASWEQTSVEVGREIEEFIL